jgi:hypothetical protein
MNTTEQLSINETVQEGLYMMQAIRTGWIHEERKKPTPNLSNIALWEAESRSFSEEEFQLNDPEKREQIQERVLKVYGPIIKSWMTS